MSRDHIATGSSESTRAESDKPIRNWGEFGLLGLFLTFCIAFGIAIRNMPFEASAYPTLIIIASSILIAVLLVDKVVKLRKSTTSTDKSPAATGEAQGRLGRAAWSRFVVLVALLGGVIWLLPRAGFLATVVLFIIVTLIYLGERKPLKVGLIAATFGILAYLFFVELLMLPLPEGEWW